MLKSKQMKKVKYVIFRYLTSADFFNIYKPSGTEEGGGGQSYIDFPVESISMNEWGKFFDGAASVFCDTGEKGPSWTFPINSIGLLDSQDLETREWIPRTERPDGKKYCSRESDDIYCPHSGR